jgi:hypothetical protein
VYQYLTSCTEQQAAPDRTYLEHQSGDSPCSLFAITLAGNCMAAPRIKPRAHLQSDYCQQEPQSYCPTLCNSDADAPTLFS